MLASASEAVLDSLPGSETNGEQAATHRQVAHNVNVAKRPRPAEEQGLNNVLCASMMK